MELPPQNITCPYTWHEKKCADLAINCPKFIHIAGMSPQTGLPVDKWGCADTYIPMLLVENSQQQRQTGAAVESFRNEMVKANHTSLELIARANGQTLQLVGKRNDG